MRLLAAIALQQGLLLYAQTLVTLAPATAPIAAQPAVTTVSVIASGFPSGSIPPANVTVSIQPAIAGGGPSGNTVAASVSDVGGATKRVFFTVPSAISVGAPTAYQVTIAGETSNGNRFASGNPAKMTLIPAAQIVSVTPDSAIAGQSATVAITGIYTNFLQGATQASFGPGMPVVSLTVTSPTKATVQLSTASAPPGPVTVTLATGAQQASLTNGFTIEPGQPPALSLNVSVGPPTSTVMASGSGFFAGEQVNLTFDTAALGSVTTDATGAFSGASLTIPASATPGAHTIAAAGQTSGITVQTSFTVRQDWTMFHFEPGHSGYNPTENVINVSNAGSLQMRWKVQTLDYLDSAPAVVGGVIYLGEDGKNPLSAASGIPMPGLAAFEPSNGQLIYQTPTAFNLDASVAIANGIVYDQEYNGGLDAFDAATGRVLWEVSTGGMSGYASPVVLNGLVYVGSLDHNVHAFDAVTGSQAWAAPTGDQVWTSPAVANGLVYAGSYDDNVYAFDAVTGKQVWSFTTGGQIFSSPAVVNGVVYIGSNDGHLYALNAGTGQEIWNSVVNATSGTIMSSPAVANGVVYIGSYDHNLYALDANTGEHLWTAPTGGEIFSSPAVANGVVYVASFDHTLYAFNASTGVQLWSFTAGATILSSPCVADGMVYIASRDKAFYAFGLPVSAR